VVAMGFSANAANPKTNDAKSSNETVATPSASKTETKLNTYYVTGISGSNYTLSTSAPSGGCKGGASPCQITSTDPLGSTVPRADVDNEDNGIEVQEFQPQLH